MIYIYILARSSALLNWDLLTNSGTYRSEICKGSIKIWATQLSPLLFKDIENSRNLGYLLESLNVSCFCWLNSCQLKMYYIVGSRHLFLISWFKFHVGIVERLQALFSGISYPTETSLFYHCFVFLWWVDLHLVLPS